MNVLESFRAVNAYPLSSMMIRNLCEGNGLDYEEEATPELRATKAYRKTLAGVYLLLAEAPNVSQGGISYSISDKDKTAFRARHNALLGELGETNELPTFGYKGSDL